MKHKPNPELIEVLGNLAKKAAELMGVPEGEPVGFTITTPYICDHCQDPEKEAFPFGVYDASGKHWDDLCNECFDELGCSYPAEYDDCSETP